MADVITKRFKLIFTGAEMKVTMVLQFIFIIFLFGPCFQRSHNVSLCGKLVKNVYNPTKGLNFYEIGCQTPKTLIFCICYQVV